jgi:hypothetical protein
MVAHEEGGVVIKDFFLINKPSFFPNPLHHMSFIEIHLILDIGR